MGKEKIRLSDIAARAGVSAATVSLVLNGRAFDGDVRISRDTAQRVRRCAAEMGYLSQGRRMMVGFIVRWLEFLGVEVLINQGISEVLGENHFGLAMGLVTDSDPQRELEEISSMEAGGFDALIIEPSFELRSRAKKPADLFGDWRRVVFVNAVPVADIPCATVDHELCGYVATRHLLDLGHRQIAFAGTHYPPRVSHRQDIYYSRFRGFIRAMEESDLPRRYVKVPAPSIELSPDLTAVYCGQTQGGAELLRFCHQRGIRVPDDLSIVGQHDTPEKSLIHPPLTAVDIRAREMGRRAAEMALALIDRRRPPSSILEPRLVVRESTRPL